MPGLLFRNRHYQAVPQERWTPQALADELKKANVHNTAAKRIDSYEALVAQHQEDRKAKARMMLGMAGLVLGLAPAVPGTYHAGRKTWRFSAGI